MVGVVPEGAAAVVAGNVVRVAEGLPRLDLNGYIICWCCSRDVQTVCVDVRGQWFLFVIAKSASMRISGKKGVTDAHHAVG